MSINVRLPDDLARRVEAVAAERGATVESATVELLSVALGEPRHEATYFPARRTLAFAAIGASGSSRGAAHADELLAEGFGRD